jgi:undecaprenyl-diphosphatase
MPYSRFLPYSILGTGVWGATFCLLGYVFWKSFSTVSKVAGRVTLGLGVVAVIAAAAVYLHRRYRDPEQRRRLEAWVDRHPVLSPVWRFVGRPVARLAWPQVQFVRRRLTAGALGIELTTCLAVAAAGAYVFILNASLLSGDRMRLLPGDEEAFTVASDLRNRTLVDIARVVTDIGAFPVVALFVLAGSVVLAVRRRPLELFVLAAGFGAVVLAVHLAKVGIQRPRPSGALVGTITKAYPSGHSAYGAMYIALAVIAARVFEGAVSRAALVLGGIALALLIAATRVYLRAHYLSDVIGGIAISLAILGLFGALALVVGHIRNNASDRSRVS